MLADSGIPPPFVTRRHSLIDQEEELLKRSDSSGGIGWVSHGCGVVNESPDQMKGLGNNSGEIQRSDASECDEIRLDGADEVHHEDEYSDEESLGTDNVARRLSGAWCNSSDGQRESKCFVRMVAREVIAQVILERTG